MLVLLARSCDKLAFGRPDQSRIVACAREDEMDYPHLFTIPHHYRRLGLHSHLPASSLLLISILKVV